MAELRVAPADRRRLALLARAWGVTEEEALTRVLDDFERSAPTVDRSAREPRLPIHAIYEGHRTDALFDPASEHVEIVTGELAGRSYRTPSGAAVDVVRLRNAAVNPNRNGWSFWTITETGDRLVSLRRKR